MNSSYKGDLIKISEKYKFDLSKEEIPKPLLSLIPEFIVDRKKELEDMLNAIRDFEFQRKMAHKWKGFAAPYGFPFLEEMSKALSEASKSENEAEVEEILLVTKNYIEEKAKTI